MLIVGDIGGTKTVLAVCGETAEGPELEGLATFQNRQFSGFTAILTHFLSARPVGEMAPSMLCLGVAGVVRDGECRMTNLPWHLSERDLATRFHLKTLLLNDLEAAAYGMGALAADERVWLNKGVAKSHGNRAVIAAGTGLGEAWLHWEGETDRAQASEGGHADFAPQNDREDALLQFLRAEFGHVSYERVLSGPGLFNIYRFLRQAGEREESPSLRGRMMEAEANPSALILEAAGEDPLCSETLSMFVSIYGAEAGNLALRTGATGGVYVGGGIAPRILERLSGGTFMRTFCDKGRSAEWMRRIPVSVARSDRTVLLGCRSCGR
jgi:glucokinase